MIIRRVCESIITPLQRAQNAAARIVFRAIPRDHVEPALK